MKWSSQCFLLAIFDYFEDPITNLLMNEILFHHLGTTSESMIRSTMYSGSTYETTCVTLSQYWWSNISFSISHPIFVRLNLCSAYSSLIKKFFKSTLFFKKTFKSEIICSKPCSSRSNNVSTTVLSHF